MKKILNSLVLSLFVILASAPVALAAEGGSGGGNATILAAIFIAVGIGFGLATIGPGLGQGNAVRGACEGMARNPGMAGKLTTTMLLGLAIIEALAIYGLVIAFMLLFVFVPQFS